MRIPALQSAKKIGGLIDTAHAALTSGMALTVQAAVQCMLHAKQHNDVTLAERLLTGVKGKANREALAAWFRDFSAVRFNNEGRASLATVKGVKQTFERNPDAWNMEGAVKVPFYEYGVEQIKRPFDGYGFLDAAIKAAENKLAKAEAGEGELAVGNNVVELRAYIARAKAFAEANRPKVDADAAGVLDKAA